MPYLNWLCTAEMDVTPGRIVYSQCLNEQGGIEADVTVTRLGRDRYLYVTGAACRVRDGAWLQRHAADFDVSVTDRTAALAVLGVMGPNARSLLAAATDADLSDTAFPFATSREIELAGCRVRASRITYVGALGWELYMDAADAGCCVRSLVLQSGGAR